MGTTDSTGTYTNSGSWNGFVGTYSQVWAVGGVNAQPTLNFNVVAAVPTPAGPINSTLGPSSSGTLTWNANGSLGQLASVDGFNAGNAATCAYQHDDLGRLSQVDCGSGKWQQGVSGDVFGNVTKTGSGYFTPGFDPLTNHVNGKYYDGNGNMTSDGANTYAWDADGNLYQFTPYQGSTKTMVYDALGRRVEQTGAEMSSLL
jgi:YD repeat-containing protein